MLQRTLITIIKIFKVLSDKSSDKLLQRLWSILWEADIGVDVFD